MKIQLTLNKKIIFTTKELAFELGKSTASISRSLTSLCKDGEVVKLTRGVWANINHLQFTPYGACSYLLANEQGYVSFLSVLHRHNIISQIPSTIQIATTGRNRVLNTSIGDFEFIQLCPELMQEGFSVWGDGVTYNIATKEKALLDCLYISTRKGNRFNYFPEINLEKISKKKVLALAKRLIKHPSIYVAVRDKVDEFFYL